jgi:hypothetical protein
VKARTASSLAVRAVQAAENDVVPDLHDSEAFLNFADSDNERADNS